MEIKQMLMQKLGIMTNNIAIEFMQLDLGDRIPTVSTLCEKYETARGTVQSSIKLLQEYKSITLESKGHLGTFITFIDHVKLLELAGINSLVGVMPLPYSKRYEGLATGVYNSMNNSGLAVNLAFMRGSNHRLKSLKDGRYDFAITSRLTAEHYITQGEEIEIVKAFGDYSYVNEHVVVVRKDFDCDFKGGIKVGIDNSSIDQSKLTTTYFNSLEVEYIPLIYSQFMECLKKGDIDVAIWNYDDLFEKEEDLKVIKIDKEIIGVSDTEAVIITTSRNPILPKLFSKRLNKEEVLKYQRDILNGIIMPNY